VTEEPEKPETPEIFEPDTALFARVSAEDGFVKRPLVCQKCGMCCKRLSHVIYYPDRREIEVESIEEIKEFLGIRYYEILEELENQIEGVNAVMVNPCPFLRDGKCTVYPVRPASCRPFPLFGDQGIGCPALKRLRDVISSYDPLDVIYVCSEDVDPVEIDEDVAVKFLKTNPSDEEVEKFFKLNRVNSRISL